MKLNSPRSFLGFVVVLLFISLPHAPAAPSVPPNERILILVSLDAFRWDYIQKFHATNLDRIASEGVHAKKMIPMFPSMTFPNHHTIVTGWRPEHHRSEETTSELQ